MADQDDCATTSQSDRAKADQDARNAIYIEASDPSSDGFSSSESSNSGQGQTVEPEVDASGPMSLRFCTTATLQAFWSFATEVRRTHSLSSRRSQDIRGSWIAPHLVVQRIHGWGQRAVRLLCVRLNDEQRRESLKLFFEKDRLKRDGRVTDCDLDPLDSEDRVIVKVPFGSSLDFWQHECQVLSDLAGLAGIPVLQRPIFFEDVGVCAIVTKYTGTQNLQDRLETGRLLPEEGLHELASFLLRVLAQAHARGWLHVDFRPEDILLASSSEGLLCGWSRARRKTEAAVAPDGIVGLVSRMPVAIAGVVATHNTGEVQAAGPNAHGSVDEGATAAGGDADGDGACQDGGISLTCGKALQPPEMDAPSLYSAPEQLVGPFVGEPCVFEATDVYRVAAVTLMAHRARGPLSSAAAFGRPMKRSAELDIATLRRLCHESLLRRAEAQASPGAEMWRPSEEQRHLFVDALAHLVQGEVDLSDCNAPELHQWLRTCLARDFAHRHQTANEALGALDAAWASLEERVLREVREEQARSEASAADLKASAEQRERRRPRKIVFEAPKELANMQVL
mmetsp:Transcript_24591/g.68483  ORF Transcript_24591/g.68483 Transcript_24591/m.68483 type:complete len:567 (-) Transcript_24591:77-1777(-)